MIRGRGAVDRRLSQLEAKQGPPPSTWDVIDPILGELSMSDLIALVQRGDNLKRGLRVERLERTHAVHRVPEGCLAEQAGESMTPDGALLDADDGSCR